MYAKKPIEANTARAKTAPPAAPPAIAGTLVEEAADAVGLDEVLDDIGIVMLVDVAPGPEVSPDSWVEESVDVGIDDRLGPAVAEVACCVVAGPVVVAVAEARSLTTG